MGLLEEVSREGKNVEENHEKPREETRNERGRERSRLEMSGVPAVNSPKLARFVCPTCSRARLSEADGAARRSE